MNTIDFGKALKNVIDSKRNDQRPQEWTERSIEDLYNELDFDYGNRMPNIRIAITQDDRETAIKNIERLACRVFFLWDYLKSNRDLSHLIIKKAIE